MLYSKEVLLCCTGKLYKKNKMCVERCRTMWLKWTNKMSVVTRDNVTIFNNSIITAEGKVFSIHLV